MGRTIQKQPSFARALRDLVIAVAATLACVTVVGRAGADTIDDLVASISMEEIRAHLTALPAPRGTPESQAATASYITGYLESLGYTVTHDPVLSSENLGARIVGERIPERTFVIAAHFDTVAVSPGADDNGASVAGMLEIARVLAGQRLVSSIELVAFSNEESGLIGSRQYVRQARDALRELTGMLSLEGIAYTCTQPGCQFVFASINGCLQINRPVPNVGTFIAGVGNDNSSDLLNTFRTAAAQYVPQLSVLTGQVAGIGGCLVDTRRSDHAPFWDHDYPALLITDTANFRNPNYHRATDTLETLDLPFATLVTQAALATALRVAGLASDPLPTPVATRPRTPIPTRTPVPSGLPVLLYADVIIDTSNHRVVGSMPVTGVSTTASPDGRRLYVSSPSFGEPGLSGRLSIIDTATNVVVATIALANPGRVAFAPDGQRAYVGNLGYPIDPGTIAVIDVARDALLTTIPTEPSYPGGGIAASPDGRFIYFTDISRKTMSVMETATHRIVQTFPVGRPSSAFGTSLPLNLAITPNGETAYVVNQGTATVTVIDTATNQVTKEILAHQSPVDIVVTPDGRTAYVPICCFNNSHALEVIDTTSNRVTTTLSLPGEPRDIALTPDGTALYVTICPQHIVVIDTATNAIADDIFTEGCANSIALAAVPNLPPLTPYPTVTPSVTPPPMTVSPTPVPTVSVCAGDCDQNGEVTVDEILIMVTLALRNSGVSECVLGDAGGDGEITIDDILAALSGALSDCGALLPTPTPMRDCDDVCDGRQCQVPFSGIIGTCSDAGESPCRCVPFGLGPTPTPAAAGDQREAM